MIRPTTAVTITCDRCARTGTHHRSPLHPDSQTARLRMDHAGWTTLGDLDLCHTCASDTTLPPHLLAAIPDTTTPVQ